MFSFDWEKYARVLFKKNVLTLNYTPVGPPNGSEAQISYK